MPELRIIWDRFDDPAQLPEDEQRLLQVALDACTFAHAPYSHFHVGAALLLCDGSVLTGNNQENIAYPSGLCAERTALFHAGAMGRGPDVRKIAIRGISPRNTISSPATPCGACRQVMAEYERMGPEPWIILCQGATGPVFRFRGVAGSLLPFIFNIDFR